jgi:GntR family transcriptional regulator
MGYMEESIGKVDIFSKLVVTRANGPLYQQLVNLIRERISNGHLHVGSDLPKESELAQMTGVSLITVRRALRELEDLGLIQKRSAKAAKVIAQSPMAGLKGHKYGTYDDFLDFTRGSRLVLVSYGQEKGTLIEKYLGLNKGETGYCLRGCLAVEGQPRTLVSTFFPADIGSRLSIKDFTDILIFENVKRVLGIKIHRVMMTARADIASAAVARELNVTPGSALMTTQMVYLSDNNRTVEVSLNMTPSQYSVLSYDVALDKS